MPVQSPRLERVNIDRPAVWRSWEALQRDSLAPDETADDLAAYMASLQGQKVAVLAAQAIAAHDHAAAYGGSNANSYVPGVWHHMSIGRHGTSWMFSPGLYVVGQTYPVQAPDAQDGSVIGTELFGRHGIHSVLLCALSATIKFDKYAE